MAQKKTRSTRKRKTKKQLQQQEKLTLIGLGFLFLLFALFGLLRLSFLGNLIANGFRMIGGNTYQVLCLALAVYSVWLIFKNSAAKITAYRRISGLLLIYAGVLLFCHAQLFSRLQSGEPNILQTTWGILLSDIKAGQVAQSEDCLHIALRARRRRSAGRLHDRLSGLSREPGDKCRDRGTPAPVQ